MSQNKFDSFGPCYVINLSDRSDRRSYIDAHFRKHGVSNYKFFEAFDGRSQAAEFKLSGSQIGCAMSHLLAMKSWYDTDIESDYLIVMEDDICLDNSQYWSWTWSEFISSIKFNFDVLHLSTWAFVDTPMPEDLSPVKRTPVDTRFLTSCYIITRSGVEQVLSKTVGMDGKKVLDFNNEENIADHKLIYGNVENYYVLPVFSPNTDLISDVDSSKSMTRLQTMASEHTSWLWRHNIRHINEITTPYE